MILGVGVDIVENERMNEKLVDRILGEDELKRLPSVKEKKIEYLSSRFAAKEAFFKAIGTGLNGFSFKDVQVMNDPDGKPYLSFSDGMSNFLRMRKVRKVHLSISHERKYSVAIVIIEGSE